ncbi:MAG: hypothetical protein ACRDEB_05405, partial [Chitinophagaceae bacterium]
MNIGILFPRSNAHPLIGSEFLGGLKAYIKKEGIDKDINLLTESVGFGGVEKEVYAKAEKLLMIDDVDILIGFIDEKVLELVKPLVLSSGKLMVLVNGGGNHPANWIPQANIITLGLRHTFLCALNGMAAAAAQKNIPAAICSTFYDCGYLHLASTVKGFTGLDGMVRFNFIYNQRYDENFNIQPLTDFLTSDESTQSLLCVFDSLPASLFYKKLNEFEGAGQLT